MRRTLVCALAASLLLVASGCPRKKTGPAEGAGGSFIPADAAAAAVFHVKNILESKLVGPGFRDPAVAEEIKQLPFDLRKIEQVTMIAVPRKDKAKPWQTPFSTVMVIRWTEPTDAKECFSKAALFGPPKFEERTHEGKTYYVWGRGLFFSQPDAKTVLLAEEEDTLRQSISGGAANGAVAEKLQAAGSDADVVAVVLLEPLRDLIEMARKGIPPRAAASVPMFNELAALPDQLKSITLTINLSSDTLAKLALECMSTESGQKVSDTLKKALEAAKPRAGMAVAAAKASPDAPAAAKDAMDVALRLLAGIEVAQAGDQVVVTVAKPQGLERLAALVPQSLARDIKQARETGLRAKRASNMRQVALAMLNYEHTHKQFPPAAIRDKQGKPLLSWRVAILPYLDQKALYDQFRLDEPWDGPNNRNLLDRMPAVYQGQRTEKDGKSTIMVFTGKETPFEEGISYRDFGDRAPNTIMAIEAGRDKAVPWTKPEDVRFDPQNPRAALGNISPQYFLAAMFDCSSHVLRSDLTAETLRRLINPREGQPVDLREVQWFPGAKARRPSGLAMKPSQPTKIAGGEWIVLSWLGPGRGRSSLWLFSPDGKICMRLTDDPQAADCEPKFSLDRRRIAFSRRVGNRRESVWVCDFDGKNARELTPLRDENEAFLSPVWVSNSRIYCTRDPKADQLPDYEVWQVDLDGQGPKMAYGVHDVLQQGEVRITDVSPDGRHMVIAAQTGGWAPTFDMYIIDLTGRLLHTIWQDEPRDWRDGRGLWSPDGNRIAWRHTFTQGAYHQPEFYGVGLARLAADGKWTAQLQPGHDTFVTPLAWSPDGSELLCARAHPGAGATLFLMDDQFHAVRTVAELETWDHYLSGDQTGRMADWAIVPAGLSEPKE